MRIAAARLRRREGATDQKRKTKEEVKERGERESSRKHLNSPVPSVHLDYISILRVSKYVDQVIFRKPQLCRRLQDIDRVSADKIRTMSYRKDGSSRRKGHPSRQPVIRRLKLVHSLPAREGEEVVTRYW